MDFSGTTTDDVVLGKTGKNGDTGANGVANTSNTWRVRATGAGNGWSSLASIGTQGAVFAASTVGYSSIGVSFDWYATTQGEANLMLRYSNDGGSTWNDVALSLSGSDAGLQVLNNSTSANTVTGSYVSDNLLNNGSLAGQERSKAACATVKTAEFAPIPSARVRTATAV